MSEINEETPMNHDSMPRSNGVLAFLVWSIVFGVSYTQAPLYYSNQNQYFLHGLARAGLGHLDQDWLANTKDPAPVFSFIVEMTDRFLDQNCFYVFYLLLLGFYFHQLTGLFSVLTGDKANRLAKLAFMTSLVVLHAGLVRLISARIFGVDYPWYFQAGVAGQYLLGFGLQPSVAGVFLIASILAFARDQRWRAIGWACLAGILHGTYLLGAAMLVFSSLLLECRQGRFRAAFAQGLAALVLVAPVVIYNLIAFSPTSAAEFAESQSILVHFRIPHHAEPERWFDGIALCQVAWVLLSLVLIRGSKLCWILSIVFVLSLLLTLVQIGTHSDTLALLFPWRTSAILVPLATAIILAKLVRRLDSWLARRSAGHAFLIKVSCGAILAVMMVGGILIEVFEWGYRTNPSELPLLEFVKTHQKGGDVYLLPVSLPKLGAGPKGAASTNFTPAPRAGKSGHLIAVDLQRFRIVTGAPVFVDFKSIPYKDVEVLEWRRRLLWAEKIYSQRDWNQAALLHELAQNGITHVVTSADCDMQDNASKLVYEDASYRIYAMRDKE